MPAKIISGKEVPRKYASSSSPASTPSRPGASRRASASSWWGRTRLRSPMSAPRPRGRRRSASTRRRSGCSRRPRRRRSWRWWTASTGTRSSTASSSSCRSRNGSARTRSSTSSPGQGRGRLPSRSTSEASARGALPAALHALRRRPAARPRSGHSPEGKHVVICGRSNIVGKPLAALLMQKKKGANATVTVCHTGTKDLPYFTRQADILVAAMGVPKAITADMIREGLRRHRRGRQPGRGPARTRRGTGWSGIAISRR